jgi:beta-hydroxylase
MFSEHPSFPFVRHLEAHAALIRADAESLELEAWDDWPDTYSYTGSWKVFGLYSLDPGVPLAWTCARNAVRCPSTIQIVTRIPGLLSAGFSMLLPGTHLHHHADHADTFADRLRCHLALWTNPRAGIRFDGRDVYWREGRCLVFDRHSPHEAANLGERSRVVLLLDVDRAACEREVLPPA